jgi:hypothetical protein
LEEPVVAQGCPRHVDASADQGDDGSDVLESLSAFLEAQVAVPVADDLGLGGLVA